MASNQRCVHCKNPVDLEHYFVWTTWEEAKIQHGADDNTKARMRSGKLLYLHPGECEEVFTKPLKAGLTAFRKAQKEAKEGK